MKNSFKGDQKFFSLRKKVKFYHRSWFKFLLVVIVLFSIGGGLLVYKTGLTLSKISTKDGFLRSLWKSMPIVGASDKLKGEEEGQINFLLLGMRGTNLPGGGLLADSIMVVSVRPAENKVAIISIPRDLYVEVPGASARSKINAVHSYAEEKSSGEGLQKMKEVVAQVTGMPIHYAARIDFKGFKELVDAIGGIDIYLDHSFSEPKQFEGENALNFSLPAGKNHIDGQKALFFVRARYASSDFDRAKRQQQVLIAIKDKLLSLGTMADFSKVNNILNILGEDVRVDMDVSEMKKMFDLVKNLSDPQIKQKVFDTSPEGMLYSSKADTLEGKTYILLPQGENYDKIHEACRNIFN